jgi:hypothetical protein
VEKRSVRSHGSGWMNVGIEKGALCNRQGQSTPSYKMSTKRLKGDTEHTRLLNCPWLVRSEYEGVLADLPALHLLSPLEVGCQCHVVDRL